MRSTNTNQPQPFTAYLFQNSPFCEAIRNLNKVLPNTTIHLKTLLPGFHKDAIHSAIQRTHSKPENPTTTVPLLICESNHDNSDNNSRAIQGSNEIISYLLTIEPSTSMIPTNPNTKIEAETLAKKIHAFSNNSFAVYGAIQLMKNRSLLAKLTTQPGPDTKHPKKLGYQACRMLYWTIHPCVKSAIREQRNFTQSTEQDTETRTRQEICDFFGQIKTRLSNTDGSMKEYLVGNQFTRADLSLSSMIAILFQPEESEIIWPQKGDCPELEQLAEDHEEIVQWAKNIYATHFKPETFQTTQTRNFKPKIQHSSHLRTNPS